MGESPETQKSPEELKEILGLGKEIKKPAKEVILIGRSNKGRIYIRQRAKDKFEVSTGKRYLVTTKSIKDAELWLSANGMKLKAMPKVEKVGVQNAK